jgi:hypothetical protein
MSVNVAIFRCSEINQTRVFPDLAVEIEVKAEVRTVGDLKSGKLVNKKQVRVYNADIRPKGASQEPMWTTLIGRAGLKSPGRHLEGRAAILVTRRRVLLHIDSGMNAKGLETRSASDQMAVVSVDRADLGPPQISRKMMGGIKRVEFLGATEPFTLLFPFVPNFDRLLELMTLEGAEQLGDVAAGTVRAAKRATEMEEREAARLAEAEKQRITAARSVA